MELRVAFHLVFEKLSVCLLGLRYHFSLEICQVQYCGDKCLKPLFNLHLILPPEEHDSQQNVLMCNNFSPVH